MSTGSTLSVSTSLTALPPVPNAVSSDRGDVKASEDNPPVGRAAANNVAVGQSTRLVEPVAAAEAGRHCPARSGARQPAGG